jgi:mannose-6-phosphate isomerase-like protein (cupin superfamily)
MPELIGEPTRVAAAGEPPKLIDEYVGLASTGEGGLSVAHMRSPSGWSEPGQRPEFDEFTIVLRGTLAVESAAGRLTVAAGQAVHTSPGEWVRYSTPGPAGAEYISVCRPAFAPDAVHRDG